MRSRPAPRRRRRPVDTHAYIDMVERVVRAAGQRVGEADADDLARLLAVRAALDEAIVAAVRGLRDASATWEDIGRAAGTTRQAALMRWGPKLYRLSGN